MIIMLKSTDPDETVAPQCVRHDGKFQPLPRTMSVDADRRWRHNPRLSSGILVFILYGKFFS